MTSIPCNFRQLYVCSDFKKKVGEQTPVIPFASLPNKSKFSKMRTKPNSFEVIKGGMSFVSFTFNCSVNVVVVNSGSSCYAVKI